MTSNQSFSKLIPKSQLSRKQQNTRLNKTDDLRPLDSSSKKESSNIQKMLKSLSTNRSKEVMN